MNLITRRGFLDRSLRTALGAAAMASCNIPGFLQEAIAQGTLPPTTKKVLFIFLRGGNDGLNTIIPWGDDAYNITNRPNLFIPKPDPQSVVSGKMSTTPDRTRIIDVGNNFAGVHPGLADLATIYNNGQAALIHRVGYSKQSRSHFDSQRYWENGTPRDNFTSSGILYRALVETGVYQGRSFPAVSVQSSNPLMLRGPIAFPNLSDPTRYDFLGVTSGGADRQKLLAAVTAGGSVPYPARENRESLFATTHDLESSIEALKKVGVSNNAFFDTDGTTHLFPIDAASNQKGVRSSAYGFFNSLKTAAQILANTDAVVAGTQLDGFDTHNSQGSATGTHADRMQWIGWGFHAVYRYLSGISPQLWNDTVIVTLSEFGRTSKENGSGGTDHAEASAMLVAGGRVKGGVYQCGNDSWTVGAQGSMFQVNSRYLRRSVDYRSVLGEIVRDHLGATPAQMDKIIPGYSNTREALISGGVSSDGTRIVGELGLV